MSKANAPKVIAGQGRYDSVLRRLREEDAHIDPSDTFAEAGEALRHVQRSGNTPTSMERIFKKPQS